MWSNYVQYYEADPLYGSQEDMLKAPPIDAIYAIYGINLRTETGFFFKKAWPILTPCSCSLLTSLNRIPRRQRRRALTTSLTARGPSPTTSAKVELFLRRRTPNKSCSTTNGVVVTAQCPTPPYPTARTGRMTSTYASPKLKVMTASIVLKV